MELGRGEIAFRVRDLEVEDAAQILQIYEPYVRNSSVTFDITVPTVDQLRARIENIRKHYPWIALEEEGKLIAYAYANHYRERLAYRWSVEVSIYVHADFKRQGRGKRLYDELLERLKTQGFHMAYAGITLPNEPSVALHEKCGFKHVGVFPNAGYKLGRWQNVGWWALELTPAVAHPKEPF